MARVEVGLVPANSCFIQNISQFISQFVTADSRHSPTVYLLKMVGNYGAIFEISALLLKFFHLFLHFKPCPFVISHDSTQLQSHPCEYHGDKSDAYPLDTPH